MLTFLFWNLANAPLASSVARLAKRHHVDILILAECSIDQLHLTRILNANRTDRRTYAMAGYSVCDRVRVVSRFNQRYWRTLSESVHYSLRSLAVPARPELVIGAVHLPSKLHHGATSQTFEARQVADAVRREESKLQNENTILVGDFNMNPFDDGMVAAGGFHAAMSRDIASRGSRVVSGVNYPFFYNPMWGHLGDRYPGPAGTHYYAQSEHVAAFWHLFDQVLLRPALMESLVYDSIEILDHDGDVPLVVAQSKRPRRTATSSDHLPIKFSLEL